MAAKLLGFGFTIPLRGEGGRLRSSHPSAADGPNLDPDRQDEPVREWCVPVAVSVMEHIPRDVLAAWMAVESFADADGRCWAGNRALARRMNLGPIASAQRALLKLEEYGIVTRHDRGGNRRALALLRRVSAPITGPEWAALMERGEARGQERSEPRDLLGRAPRRRGTRAGILSTPTTQDS